MLMDLRLLLNCFPLLTLYDGVVHAVYGDGCKRNTYIHTHTYGMELIGIEREVGKQDGYMVL